MADQQRFGISEPLSTAPATDADLKSSAALKEYLRSRGMYESHAEASRREEVLGKLDRLVKEWVRDASAAKGFAEPFLSEVPVHTHPHRALFSSGVSRSYSTPGFGEVDAVQHLRVSSPPPWPS
jgi:hypothetical protein